MKGWHESIMIINVDVEKWKRRDMCYSSAFNMEKNEKDGERP